MALHRKIFSTTRFVCSFDPAIKDGYDEYVKAGYDMSKLQLVDGEKPTIFFVDQLSPAQKNYVDMYGGRSAKSARIQCALVNVTEYYTVTPEGESRQIRDIDRKETGQLGKMVTDEWFAAAAFSDRIVDELDAAIQKVSDPDPF